MSRTDFIFGYVLKRLPQLMEINRLDTKRNTDFAITEAKEAYERIRERTDDKPASRNTYVRDGI